MKKTLLLACWFCLPFLTTAQDYRPFPLGDAVWQDVFYIWWSIHGIEYIQAGDTLVPGHALSKKLYARHTFFKSYANPSLDTVYNELPVLIGAISQDTVAKKVYYTAYDNNPAYYPPGIGLGLHPQPDSTVLLYDFDLEVLQTANVPEAFVFWETEMIQFKDSSWSRRYLFLDSDFMPDTNYYWIAGVGGAYGLFTPLVDGRVTDSDAGFSCFSENGVPLYPPHISACGDVSVSVRPEGFSRIAIQLYPNPATDRITVEVPPWILPARFRIVDAQGRTWVEQELHTSRTEMPLPDAPGRALLIVHVVGKDGQAHSRVLVR
jgi:hypothetical protein